MLNALFDGIPEVNTDQNSRQSVFVCRLRRRPRGIGQGIRIAVGVCLLNRRDRAPEVVEILGFQDAMYPSAMDRLSNPNNRAFSQRSNPLLSEMGRARRFQASGELSSQNKPIWVCSAVRVLGVMISSPPIAFTSLKSAVYSYW